MKITAKDLKALRHEANQGTKKFVRLKEKEVKGCFYQAAKDGLVTCILRYDFHGINKVYTVATIGTSLGQVSLGAALSMAKRRAREIAAGNDPQADYKAEKQEKKLAEKVNKDPKSKDDAYVAERADAYYLFNNSVPATKKNIRSALNEIVTAFGHKRVKDVTRKDVTDLLLSLESRGAEGKYSVGSNVQKTGCAMWNWGMDIGDFEVVNYFAALKSIKKRQKNNGVQRKMQLSDVKAMANIHYATFPSSLQRCIILQAYTAVRPANVTSADPMVLGGPRFPIDWSEFDLTEGTWHLKKERMKGRQRAHIIDMPHQLIAHLKVWHKEDGYPEKGVIIRTLRNKNETLAPNMLNKRYKLHNLPYTPHSWRACIGTEIAEMEGCSKEIADYILAHYKSDTYINTTKPVERKKWLQVWADKLDTLGFDKILIEARKDSIDLKVISR